MTSNAAFATALLSPDAEVPEGVIAPAGHTDAKRFSVYRNNVMSSLLRILEANFPVLRALVGDEYFKAMAAEFVREMPPKTPLMALYGAEFPQFLSNFAPVAHLPYLPCVARLEQALRESYYAADAAPLNPATLGSLSEEALLARRFTLAPALRLIRSPWPVFGIWQAHHGGAQPMAEPQDVVIFRAEFDPKPVLLPKGGYEFLISLAKGAPLHTALEAAGEGFDLGPLLTTMLQENGFARD